MSLLDKLLRRGLITGIYPESIDFRNRLRQVLTSKSTVYTGFDATAPSLHVGNLATIVNSLHFQADGHQVICVIGDATAQIGDPSGHNKDRQKLTKAVIEYNASCLEETLRQIFQNFRKYFLDADIFKRSHTGQSITVKEPIFIRNSEWYNDRNVVEFVSNVFREVRVGWLLHKTSIQERLKTREGMNAAELCYQIFQAYDWLILWERYNCQLQIGGNDQSGNIYTGHDMIKRQFKSRDSFGLLTPLITIKGKKLGKSTEKFRSGIWLRSDKTSPFDLYQFFHRTPDADVRMFLRVFSFYDDQIITDFIDNHLKNPKDIWYCQRKLAEHACLLVHGPVGLDEAKRETEKVFHIN